METINNNNQQTNKIDLTEGDKTTPTSTSLPLKKNKLVKSPKLGKNSSQVTPVQQVPSNAVEKARKEIEELYDYMKTIHNMHGEAKRRVVKLRSTILVAGNCRRGS